MIFKKTLSTLEKLFWFLFLVYDLMMKGACSLHWSTFVYIKIAPWFIKGIFFQEKSY